MLTKRKYVFDKSHKLLSFEEFETKSDDDLTINVTNQEDKSIIVFFLEDESVGVKQLRKYIDRLIEAKSYHTILIIKKNITSAASTFIIDAMKEGIEDPEGSYRKINIEIFKYENLMIDITEHDLVPLHEKIEGEELAAFLKKYPKNLDTKEYPTPKLEKIDPITRFYGYQKGDIIKITRISETAGIYINYRAIP
jgi:DNA-directed RNA polymerase I, II, and III subunit RPABC1